MSEQEWPTLGYSVKGNRYEIKATRGEIYEAYTDEQIIELVDRRALAAKDARIAELEQSQGAEVFLTLTGEISKLRAQLASQQRAEPATPSEDGRDSVQVVAFLMKPDFYEPYVSLHRDSQTSALCEPLMTVAQHERIVDAERGAHLSQLRDWRVKFMNLEAAKDAEIAEWREQRNDLIEGNNLLHAEIAELRAQPARQVGDVQLTGEYHADVNMLLERIPHQVGDEPIHDDDLVLVPRGLLGAARYAIKNKVDAPNVHGQLGEYCYGQAALAPAAVAVDSSAPLVNALEQVRTMVGNDEYADDVIGFINRAIYNHARLNRRAIPAGLLERIAKIPLGSQGLLDHASAMDELRALLGKS